MSDKQDQILELLNMRVGETSIDVDESNGYLVLVNCHNNMAQYWNGPQMQIEPTADCTITLSRIQVIVSIIKLFPIYLGFKN